MSRYRGVFLQWGALHLRCQQLDSEEVSIRLLTVKTGMFHVPTGSVTEKKNVLRYQRGQLQWESML